MYFEKNSVIKVFYRFQKKYFFLVYSQNNKYKFECFFKIQNI